MTVYALSNREHCTIKITELEASDHDAQSVINEISLNKHIRHVNILPLLNCFVQDSQIWCVYPYMFYGSCKDILDCINNLNLNEEDKYYVNNEQVKTVIDRADEQKRLCFNEQSLQPIIKSVLAALDYLHSKHIIHRCVCPENILISQNGHVYLSGLQFSVSLIQQGSLMKKLHDFPPNINEYLNYLSPEILQQNLIGYNTKSDIYSLGISLCELANGVNPFVGCEKTQMLLEKLAGFDVGLWDHSILTPESKNLFASVCAAENPKVIASIQRRFFSEKFRNFVDLCVLRNYEVRPSAVQLLHHSYLKKMKLSSVLSTLQMSVMCDGVIEVQKKIASEPTVELDKPSISADEQVPLDAFQSWNF